MTDPRPSSSERRADLDWLRVLAFGLLIAYHAGMPYSGWVWHIQNPVADEALREAMRFVNRWRMPLIFLVSGAAIMLALGGRDAGAFVADRLRRILLPLLCGIFLTVLPQVYIERLRDGRFDGSLLEFVPHFFEGVYPSGNFSWHHLWFLAYVLILSLLLLPLFLWLRQAARAPGYAAWLGRLGGLGLHWLFAAGIFLCHVVLLPISKNEHAVYGDWHGLATAGLYLLLGAWLFSSGALLDRLARQRLLALAIGLACYLALYFGFFRGTLRPVVTPELRSLFAALNALNTVAWLFAIVGFARQYLWRRPRALGLASEAVYPFYILHQLVTVLAAHAIVDLTMPVGGKYALTLLATLLGTTALYILLIRPFRLARLAFGMKLNERPSPATLSAAADPLRR